MVYMSYNFVGDLEQPIFLNPAVFCMLYVISQETMLKHSQ